MLRKVVKPHFQIWVWLWNLKEEELFFGQAFTIQIQKRSIGEQDTKHGPSEKESNLEQTPGYIHIILESQTYGDAQVRLIDVT